MGKRGPQPPGMVASVAYFLRPLPVSRERAGEILGAEVQPEAWGRIEKAWRDCDATLAMIRSGTTKPGHANARERALERLKEALDLLYDQRADHDGNRLLRGSIFRHVAAGIADAELIDRMDALDIDRHLVAAGEILERLALAVRDAEPQEIRLPTEGAARAELARLIRGILKGADVPCALSDARNLDYLHGEPGLSATDLSGFERLIHALEIHETDSLRALAKWLRDACGTKPRAPRA